MTAAEQPPAYCSPQELVDKGYQPVFCTPNQSGVHTPLSGTTGGKAPWPTHAPEPSVPYRLALRPPPDVLIVDVDDHDGLATGPRTLAVMEAELGPLPPTWRLSARGPTDPAGRRLYRIPADLIVTDALFKTYGGDIEAVRTGWRFSWAPGDINPKTGTPVVVYGPDGLATELPAVSELPEWPAAWVARFRTAPQPVSAAPGPAASATEQFMRQDPPARLSAARAAIERKLEQVAQHEGSGFRNLLSGAALLLAGYAAGAPQFFDAERLREALEDAVTRRWNSKPDDEDERWIADGWYDGTYKHAPLRVYDETQPMPQEFLVPDNVVQMPGVPAWQQPTPLGRPRLRDMLVGIDGLRNIPPPEPLVDGWLFKDSLSWVSGDPGSGKSLVVIDLVCCVATGRRWHGFGTVQGPVLYIIAEGLRGMTARVDAWSALNQSAHPPVTFLPWAAQLTSPEDVSELEELVREGQYAVVVVDTQSRSTVGVDENAAKDMGVMVHNLDRLRRASGACVITVHHTARGANNLRGSSVVTGAADTTLLLTRDAQSILITADKQKDTADGAKLTLQITPAAGSVSVTAQADTNGAVGAYTDTERRVLNHLRLGNAWSATELMDALDLPKSSAYDAIRGLRERGDIHLTDSTQPKRYAATVLGPQISAYSDVSQPGNGVPQPVDNPVDNRRNLLRKLGQIPEPDSGVSEQNSESKTAGHSVIPEESETDSNAQGKDSGPPPPFRGAGKPESLGSSDTGGPQVGVQKSGPQALPDTPEPAPKKRAEPRPGTKAYERAQAKAAEKAERIALAAGGSVQYPAVVLRDGQVLESPLSTAEGLLSGLSELTVDVESSGVPIGHKDYELRLVQLGNDEFAVDLDPKDPAQMELAARVLAAAPVLHAHSSTADIVPLAHAGHVDFDSAMERMDDTAIRAKLNDPQSTGSDAGLKRISDYMLGADSASTPAEEARMELFKANGWLSEPKADTPVERNGWYQVDPACKTFARYGGSDVLDTALIAKRLAQIPPHIAARENAVAHMVSRIALKGIKLNGALIGDLMTEHVMKRDEWAKAIQSWTSIDNVGSDKQVAQALLGMGVRLPYTKPSTRFPDGQPSVAAGVLETLQGELDGTGHPAATLIEQVLTWRHHDTAITLFLTPYSVLVNDGDGRARPTVYTLGADTGRMSCTRPNIQQLPREGGFRAMFVADEGMTFISADFSSVEIRVAAALSQDQALIRMLEEGLDPHAMAAAIVYGPDFTKAQRYAVKRGVFGRIYGGGVSTLAAQMRVSVAIAQKLIDAIDTLWPTLSAWSKASTQAVERGLETTFTTYSGRVVHLPKKAAHAAGNYKIQGTARELLVDALMRWRETKWGKAIMWPVHDELDVMVPIEDAEAATAELVRCMETELFGVRIVAEPSAPSPVWQDAA